ncbi:MAG: hypothetical protein FJ385_04005 [Verrucomicrobia bacterium]|nr:hypothetical protein [Verrucomicrobiota bacterium]
MHRPRHRRTIWYFRIAALMLLFKFVGYLAVMILLLVAWNRNDYPQVLLALGILGLMLVTTVVVRLQAMHCKCPLCMTPVMGKPRCAKHKRAKRFLGSYRLRVALSILTLGHFLCPYCNEYTRLELKD